ncbi:MAG: biopolymer transporter ExbD, partial [Bacteroidota bacterium]
MPKVKIPRKNISLDMTAMCDMAFLLLSFFMLTTSFKPDDPVVVDTPSSISKVKLPDADLMTIAIDKNGIVFFAVDAQPTRESMLNSMAGKYQLSFTPKQIQQFSLMSAFGVPVNQLPGLLDLPSGSRSKVKQPGIPIDSADNQLRDWIAFARYANPKMRIAIRG